MAQTGISMARKMAKNLNKSPEYDEKRTANNTKHVTKSVKTNKDEDGNEKYYEWAGQKRKPKRVTLLLNIRPK